MGWLAREGSVCGAGQEDLAEAGGSFPDIFCRSCRVGHISQVTEKQKGVPCREGRHARGGSRGTPAWGGLCCRRGYDGWPEQLRFLRRRDQANISWVKQQAALGQMAELSAAPAAWLWDGAQPGMLGGSLPRDLGWVAPRAPSTLPGSARKRAAARETLLLHRLPGQRPGTSKRGQHEGSRGQHEGSRERMADEE